MTYRYKVPKEDLAPWRAVTEVKGYRTGRGGILGPDTSRRLRWWELKLECGHEVERNLQYVKDPSIRTRGGTQRMRNIEDAKPPPKRVRCEYCPTPRESER